MEKYKISELLNEVETITMNEGNVFYAELLAILKACIHAT